MRVCVRACARVYACVCVRLCVGPMCACGVRVFVHVWVFVCGCHVFALKTHNADHRDRQIFINEDLTARRGKLAYDTRQLKKAHKISDCWTTYGKVMTKDLAGKITEVK